MHPKVSADQCGLGRVCLFVGLLFLAFLAPLVSCLVFCFVMCEACCTVITNFYLKLSESISAHLCLCKVEQVFKSRRKCIKKPDKFNVDFAMAEVTEHLSARYVCHSFACSFVYWGRLFFLCIYIFLSVFLLVALSAQKEPNPYCVPHNDKPDIESYSICSFCSCLWQTLALGSLLIRDESSDYSVVDKFSPVRVRLSGGKAHIPRPPINHSKPLCSLTHSHPLPIVQGKTSCEALSISDMLCLLISSRSPSLNTSKASLTHTMQGISSS